MPLALLLLLFLITGCATTPEDNQQTSDDTPIVETGERLIASPPANWQRVYQVNNQTLRLSDFIPSGEEPSNWKTKLSFESHLADQIEIDPLDLLKIDADSAQKTAGQHSSSTSMPDTRTTTRLLSSCCCAPKTSIVNWVKSH